MYKRRILQKSGSSWAPLMPYRKVGIRRPDSVKSVALIDSLKPRPGDKLKCIILAYLRDIGGGGGDIIPRRRYNLADKGGRTEIETFFIGRMVSGRSPYLPRGGWVGGWGGRSRNGGGEITQLRVFWGRR